MNFIKFIAGILLTFLGGYIVAKGFGMPNCLSAARFFVIGILIATAGSYLWYPI